MRGKDERIGEGKKARKKREKSDLIEFLPRITQSRKLKPIIQVSCEPKLDLAQVRFSPTILLRGCTLLITHITQRVCI